MADDNNPINEEQEHSDEGIPTLGELLARPLEDKVEVVAHEEDSYDDPQPRRIRRDSQKSRWSQKQLIIGFIVLLLAALSYVGFSAISDSPNISLPTPVQVTIELQPTLEPTTKSTKPVTTLPNSILGSGRWVDSDDMTHLVDFYVYDGSPDSGHLRQIGLGGEYSFVVNVETVRVYSRHACFGGYVVEASGSAADSFNDYYWVTVRDGGAGSSDGEDYIRGKSFAEERTPPLWCTNGDMGGNLPFSSGGVEIQYSP